VHRFVQHRQVQQPLIVHPFDLPVTPGLRSALASALTLYQRGFLLGLVAGEPDWQLMECRHFAELPASRWKLQNLAKLKKANPDKFARQADELRSLLGL
jgi:hypothetical protein